MELKLLRNDANVVRIAASGPISWKWLGTHDPLTALYGDDIYQQNVILGLAESTYMDSAGVGWLLAGHRKFQKHGGMLVLHSASPMTRQILKLMRLDRVLHLADDESAARTVIDTRLQGLTGEVFRGQEPICPGPEPD